MLKAFSICKSVIKHFVSYNLKNSNATNNTAFYHYNQLSQIFLRVFQTNFLILKRNIQNLSTSLQQIIVYIAANQLRTSIANKVY